MHRQMHRAAGVACLAFLLGSTPAFAIGEISTPGVTKGKLEAEYVAVRLFDDARDQDKLLTHEVELKYGWTDRFKSEIGIEFEDAQDKATIVEKFGFAGQYEILPMGEGWIDSAIKLGYNHKPHASADELKAQVLLEKRYGAVRNLATAALKQSLGSGAGAGGPSYEAQLASRYAFTPEFSAGIELDSDFGKGRDFDEYSRQEHYVGPGIYGALAEGVDFEAAYLRGISKAAADSAVRLVIEYEVKF